MQQLPHGFHSFIALATLILELGAVWMLFLPRRWRIACFCVVSPFQLGIILTANLAFINHLVLILGVLLLDDRCLQPVRARGGRIFRRISTFDFRILRRPSAGQPVEACDPGLPLPEPGLRTSASRVSAVALALKAILLTWIFYNTTALLTLMLAPYLPLPASPIAALEPFRISNQYGLFATMTRARYEIEFQGSNDGKQWTAYPFKYKPQDPSTAPRIYAPYQPRFDWNLWFASLGSWREYPWVLRVEELLLQNDQSVFSLFAGDPFGGRPPERVRAVLWQYWFTDRATKRATGLWWRRELRGLYAPELDRQPDGKILMLGEPEMLTAPP